MINYNYNKSATHVTYITATLTRNKSKTIICTLMFIRISSLSPSYNIVDYYHKWEMFRGEKVMRMPVILMVFLIIKFGYTAKLFHWFKDVCACVKLSPSKHSCCDISLSSLLTVDLDMLWDIQVLQCSTL